MGAVFSPPKPPAPPPPPPPQPNPPSMADPKVGKRREIERRRAALSVGRDDTILTSPQGLPSRSVTQFKTLLGA